MGQNCGGEKERGQNCVFISFNDFCKPESKLLYMLSSDEETDFPFINNEPSEDEADYDTYVYLYTNKPLNHGYEIPFFPFGSSFDVYENYCFGKLENESIINNRIQVARLSTENDRFFNWAYFADGCRGYCYSYNVAGIKAAIRKKLSTMKGKFICVYGPEMYILTEPQIVQERCDAYDRFLTSIQSIFQKHRVFSANCGFNFVLLSDAGFPCDFKSISICPASCAICIKEANETQRIIDILNIDDLEE